MIEMTYSNWEDLSQVEKDVIHAIDQVTIYGEDLDKGLVKITVEYVGKTWDRDALALEEWTK